MISLINTIWKKLFYSKNGKIKVEDLPNFLFKTKPNKKYLSNYKKLHYPFPQFHKVYQRPKRPIDLKSQNEFIEIRQEFENLIEKEEAQILFNIFLKNECSVARTAELAQRPIEHVHLMLEYFGVDNPYRPDKIYREESLLA